MRGSTVADVRGRSANQHHTAQDLNGHGTDTKAKSQICLQNFAEGKYGLNVRLGCESQQLDSLTQAVHRKKLIRTALTGANSTNAKHFIPALKFHP